ncbi:MAG TPA: hypothetical protein VEB22_05580 [Phycisphaerales bacterium]|nr:hypothetical protein [Phycisphaerales bacterium]
MPGRSDIINGTLSIVDSGSAANTDSKGNVDSTKSMTLPIKINKDSGTAGVGIVTLTPTKGSAQVMTSVATAWWILKFGNETQKGGFLMKTDGTAFANADLPTAAALYANCIAFCSDGLYACKNDGSSWTIIGTYALT